MERGKWRFLQCFHRWFKDYWRASWSIWKVGEKDYKNFALLLQKKIYDVQVKDGSLYEFFDWKYNIPKTSTPLCYLNLKVIKKLQKYNKGWRKYMIEVWISLRKGRLRLHLYFTNILTTTLAGILLMKSIRKRRNMPGVYPLHRSFHGRGRHFRWWTPKLASKWDGKR